MIEWVCNTGTMRVDSISNSPSHSHGRRIPRIPGPRKVLSTHGQVKRSDRAERIQRTGIFSAASQALQIPGQHIHVCQKLAESFNLKRLNLVNVRMHHLTTHTSFPALKTMGLIDCYGVQDFLKSVTQPKPRPSSFRLIKYTSFRDTETVDGSFVANCVGSVKHLRYHCIQIPPHIDIKFAGKHMVSLSAYPKNSRRSSYGSDKCLLIALPP